jgi:hypothetical protein
MWSLGISNKQIYEQPKQSITLISCLEVEYLWTPTKYESKICKKRKINLKVKFK